MYAYIRVRTIGVWESLSERRTKELVENNRTNIKGNNENRMGIKEKQWGDNNRSAIVYVAQWENLEQWYDIGGRRKRTEIVGTIDKGLGPGVQKHGLECRHVMRAG